MRRERIIYLSALVIVAIILINLFRDDSDMKPLQLKRFWIVKTHSKKNYPVVFAGDSRIYRGISPGEFEKTFPGMKGVNLGYSSNGYHPVYMKFIESRLDLSADRQALVLGISPYSFTQRGLLSYHYLFEKNERKKEEIIQSLYFYNVSARFLPFDILNAFAWGGVKNDSANLQFTYHSDGWMETACMHPDTSRSDVIYQTVFNSSQYVEEGAATFYRQVKEWTDREILVVAFRTPTALSIRTLEDSLSGFDEENFRVAFENSGGQWIDIERSDYKTYDGNHLDPSSARKLSRDLAAAIREIADDD